MSWEWKERDTGVENRADPLPWLKLRAQTEISIQFLPENVNSVGRGARDLRTFSFLKFLEDHQASQVDLSGRGRDAPAGLPPESRYSSNICFLLLGGGNVRMENGVGARLFPRERYSDCLIGIPFSADACGSDGELCSGAHTKSCFRCGAENSQVHEPRRICI